MDYNKRQVLKNIVEQMVYANFNEEERQYIDIEEYTDGLVADVEDWLDLVKDEIKYEISLRENSLFDTKVYILPQEDK